MNNLSKLAVFSLAVILFAPALKSRFGISDQLVYFLPFAVFTGVSIVLNITLRTFFSENLQAALVYLLLMSSVFLAFLVGDAQNANLLFVFSTNCLIAALVVVFPWNHKSMHLFFLCCTLIGTVLALYNVSLYGTTGIADRATGDLDTGYITAGTAIGFACIASLYLVVIKTSIISVLLLTINWVGLSSGPARGALIMCALVSLIFIVFVVISKTATRGWGKKISVLGVSLLMLSLAIYSVISLGSLGRWTQLLASYDNVNESGGRGPLMREAVGKISQSPVFGNGLGEYAGYYGNPHNIFLQYGVDAGIIGMVLVLVFLLIVAAKGFIAVKRHAGDESSLAFVSWCFFLFIVGNMLKSADAYLYREFFIASALPIVMYQLYRQFRT